MCVLFLLAFSASHGLRLGMDGMLIALCDHGFERSGLCAVNNNNNNKAPTVRFSVLGTLTGPSLHTYYLIVYF